MICIGVLLRSIAVAKCLVLVWREGWQPWKWLLVAGPLTVLLPVLLAKPGYWPLMAFYAEFPYMVALGGADRPDEKLTPAFRLYPVGVLLSWWGCFLAFVARQ